MSEHIKEWLNAYLDGELRSARRRQVENHLAECDECQAELDGLQGLSALLRETATAGEFITTERFVSNLTLNLPRQPEAIPARKALEIGWWLIPVSVLGIWAFVQVTLSLSSVFQAASAAGLFGNTFIWLQGSAPQTTWFVTLTDLFGSQLDFTGRLLLSTLNDSDLFIRNLIDPFLWQAILAVIYLGWLASWWFRQQGQSSNSGTLEFPSQS